MKQSRAKRKREEHPIDCDLTLDDDASVPTIDECGRKSKRRRTKKVCTTCKGCKGCSDTHEDSDEASDDSGENGDMPKRHQSKSVGSDESSSERDSKRPQPRRLPSGNVPAHRPPQPQTTLDDADGVGHAMVKYGTLHMLKFSDRIADGFMCGGRTVSVGSAESVNRHLIGRVPSDIEDTKWSPSRELMVLESEMDPALADFTATARRLIANLTDAKDRLVRLGEYVASLFGSHSSVGVGHPKVDGAHRDVWRVIRKRAPSGSAVLLLGDLIGKVGVCRHRATLFKYWADQSCLHEKEWAPNGGTGIRVGMLRGQHVTTKDSKTVSINHTWCMAEIDGKMNIVELFNSGTHPIALIPIDSPAAKAYQSLIKIPDRLMRCGRFWSGEHDPMCLDPDVDRSMIRWLYRNHRAHRSVHIPVFEEGKKLASSTETVVFCGELSCALRGDQTVKVVRKSYADRSSEDFMRELWLYFILNAVPAPGTGVVRLIGVSMSEHSFYFAECPSGNIGDYLRAHPKLSPMARLRLCKAMATAVAKMHGHHATNSPILVHTDIKPENMLVEKEGDDQVEYVAVITDIESSALVSDRKESVKLTKTTPVFKAPEMFGINAPWATDWNVATVASDTYALGLSMLYVLSGMLPWSNGATLASESDIKTRMIATNRHGIMHVDPTANWTNDMRARAPKIPELLVERLSYMLCFRPELRPAADATEQLVDAVITVAHATPSALRWCSAPYFKPVAK